MIKNPELKIKKIREFRNYTQAYMASQLNLSTRAYSKLETGETQLTINRINEISTILNISSLELLSFDENKIFNHPSSSYTADLFELLNTTLLNLKEHDETLRKNQKIKADQF